MERLDYKNTKLVLHRGLSSAEVENTLPAFLLACNNRHAYGVECDVQVTRDGKFVVFHDRTLKRMCGVDQKLKKLTYDQIKSLPLFDKTGVLSKRYHVPTLIEYLDICKTYNKVAVIEIKSKMTYIQVKQFFAQIKQHYNINNVIIISFHIKCLIYMRWMSKKVKLQHICEYKVKRRTLMCRAHNIGLDYNMRLMDSKTIGMCKKYNLSTNVWTPNTIEAVQKYVDMGVDYVTSNYVF